MLSRTVLTFSNSQWDPNTLFISKVDEVYIKIEAESPIKQELSDFFTFTVPNAASGNASGGGFPIFVGPVSTSRALS